MINVALVEDNAPFRATLREIINETAGFHCLCECASSKQALIELPQYRPQIVLMDIHLPGESGIVCTARLKEKLPELPIIMLTAYKDHDLIFQALKAGASGYLLKRASAQEIIRAIEDVQTGGAPMTGEIARLVVRSFHAPSAIRETHPAATLSAREREILALLSEGCANKQIAQKLGISAETVRTHLGHIYEKLHVRCRTEAAALYFKHAVG